MNNLRPFTVIGVWDSGLVAYDIVEADDAMSAMVLVAKQHGFAADLQIIGALYGHEAHGLTAPCEDSGNAAYASDLEQMDEEERFP